MNRRMTEEQAKKTYERAIKMEQEFGEYFTGMVKIIWKTSYRDDILWLFFYLPPNRRCPRRYHRGDLQQSEIDDLVPVGTNHLGTFQGISMTNSHHNLDTAASSSMSTSLENNNRSNSSSNKSAAAAEDAALMMHHSNNRY